MEVLAERPPCCRMQRCFRTPPRKMGLVHTERGGLLLKRKERFFIRCRQTRGPERLCLEALRLADRCYLSINHLGKRNFVRPGNRHRSHRRALKRIVQRLLFQPGGQRVRIAEIPRHTVKAFGRRAVQPAHNLPGRIPHGQEYRGRFFFNVSSPSLRW